MNTMLTEKDKLQLKNKGITEKELSEQLSRFGKGFPFLKIEAAATVEKGILVLNEAEKKKYQGIWENYTKGNGVVTKFVPASGAASRMFKDLFNFLSAPYNIPTTDFEKEFFNDIKNFAFYKTLDTTCQSRVGKSITDLMKQEKYKDIVQSLLSTDGMNYGNLPKGLLEFHKYSSITRTPVEEHLVEGALYANVKGVANLHFTVSSEHKALFDVLVKKHKALYEKEYNTIYNISFSEQKSSTDTLAVNMDNTPFRDGDGSLLFRPGGHGALIENLNDIDSSVVFVKNIDNTIPDKLKGVEVLYKKILAGVLIDIQTKVFDCLKMLESGNYTHDELIKMLYFLQKELNIKNPETKLLEDAELAIYIKNKLNRPIRVCGMVRNEGEPGGGPFLTQNTDSTISLQILEGSQIDTDVSHNKTIVKNSTHFNPVDLVCALKDYQGTKFDLLKYVDPHTGFISEKSQGGKKLKALELPGLWNGAMSDWNTIFVEVPIETFNPVKTVNDLLRENHL